MAGELALKLTTTGLTLKALILNGNRTKRWNGAAFVALSSVADAAWGTGLVTMDEQVTSDSTTIAIYVADFPAGINAPAEYFVLFYSGVSPSPDQQALGQQTISWDGLKSITLETLSDQIDGIDTGGGGTGTGARTVNVTVDDGIDPLENAVVRFTEGANTYPGSTNVNGELSFSLDDAAYDLAISKSGYTFTPTTLVVNGDENETYSMTITAIIAPPNASTATGVMTVYDEKGNVEENVDISIQIIDGPGTDGIGYDSTVWSETSSVLGVVQFAGIIHGATYKIWRGDSKANAQTFTAPSSGTSFDLSEVIGRG